MSAPEAGVRLRAGTTSSALRAVTSPVYPRWDKPAQCQYAVRNFLSALRLSQYAAARRSRTAALPSPRQCSHRTSYSSIRCELSRTAPAAK